MKKKDGCKGILEFEMKEKIRFTQVIECEKESEVNKLLDLEWILIDTVAINYDDGGGFIRTMMGNIGEKVEYQDLIETLGRKRTGLNFYDKK